jgi:hypothetical protein
MPAAVPYFLMFLQYIEPNNLSPLPGESDFNTLRNAYASQGAVIYSSQWVGWVPEAAACGGNGKLSAAKFSISNLVINGTVAHGPTPTMC